MFSSDKTGILKGFLIEEEGTCNIGVWFLIFIPNISGIEACIMIWCKDI